MFNSIKKIDFSALFVSQRIALSVFLAKLADTPVPRNFYTCGRQPDEIGDNQLKEARWSLLLFNQTWVAPAARLTHPVGHLKYISQHLLTSSNISDCRSNISNITAGGSYPARSENQAGHFNYTSFFYSTHQPCCTL